MTPSLYEATSGEDVSQGGFWKLSNPKLAAYAFVAVALMGLAAATVYLVGRLGSAAPVAAPVARTVEARPASQKAQPARVSVQAAPPPVAAQPKPPAAAPTQDASKPVVGQTYLQVAATDRPGAEKLLLNLRAQSIPSLITEGPSPEIVRVVAGPITSDAQAAGWKSSIEKLGFKPFPRKY